MFKIYSNWSNFWSCNEWFLKLAKSFILMLALNLGLREKLIYLMKLQLKINLFNLFNETSIENPLSDIGFTARWQRIEILWKHYVIKRQMKEQREKEIDVVKKKGQDECRLKGFNFS